MSRQTNSLGNEYWWTAVGSDDDVGSEYLLNIEVDARPKMGGHVGIIEVNTDDLGAFEATGGPRISIGDTVEGRVVNHIRKTEEGFVVTVD